MDGRTDGLHVSVVFHVHDKFEIPCKEPYFYFCPLLYVPNMSTNISKITQKFTIHKSLPTSKWNNACCISVPDWITTPCISLD